MNADHECAVLDWNYASVQDTAGYSELNSIDGDPTFEIDQNEPIDVGPRGVRHRKITPPPPSQFISATAANFHLGGGIISRFQAKEA